MYNIFSPGIKGLVSTVEIWLLLFLVCPKTLSLIVLFPAYKFHNILLKNKNISQVSPAVVHGGKLLRMVIVDLNTAAGCHGSSPYHKCCSLTRPFHGGHSASQGRSSGIVSLEWYWMVKCIFKLNYKLPFLFV